MEKAQVIKLRDELKCGKNIPIRVLINNSFTIIDESHRFHFTKWDDTNGILYSFRLMDIRGTDHALSNRNAITVFAVSYDTIEAMEIPVMPLEDLDTLFDNLGNGGCTFSDDYRNLIKYSYMQALSPNNFRLSPTDYNDILGPEAANDKDDYYNHPSKFVQSTQETLRYKEYNQKIIDSQKSDDEP